MPVFVSILHYFHMDTIFFFFAKSIANFVDHNDMVIGKSDHVAPCPNVPQAFLTLTAAYAIVQHTAKGLFKLGVIGEQNFKSFF